LDRLKARRNFSSHPFNCCAHLRGLFDIVNRFARPALVLASPGNSPHACAPLPVKECGLSVQKR
jgi:hypothetical protein